MDIVQHGAHGFLMAKAFEYFSGIDASLSLEISSAVAGALPDLIGVAGQLIERNSDDPWRLYNLAHKGYVGEFFLRRVWLYWLRLMPPYFLHIWLDTLCHDPGKRWWVWKERMWMEIVGWIISIILFVILRNVSQ